MPSLRPSVKTLMLIAVGVLAATIREDPNADRRWGVPSLETPLQES